MLSNLPDHRSSGLDFVHINVLPKTSLATARVFDMPFVISVAVLEGEQLIQDMVGMFNPKLGQEDRQHILQACIFARACPRGYVQGRY